MLRLLASPPHVGPSPKSDRETTHGRLILAALLLLAGLSCPALASASPVLEPAMQLAGPRPVAVPVPAFPGAPSTDLMVTPRPAVRLVATGGGPKLMTSALLFDIVCAGGVAGGCGSSGGGSFDATGDYDLTGTVTATDAGFSIVDEADDSKGFAVSVGSKTAGTVSTLAFSGGAQTVTFPATSFTVAGLGLGNTFTTTNNFNGSTIFGSTIKLNSDQLFRWGTPNDVSWKYSTALTPDGVLLGTGSLSNALIIAESADIDANFDFAHALQTNPTIYIHSAAQSTTQWLGLTHDGSNGLVTVGTGSLVLPATVELVNSNVSFTRTGSAQANVNALFSHNTNGTLNFTVGSLAGQGFRQKGFPIAEDLTESTATAFVRIAVASGEVSGGVVEYTIEANDGTDYQSRAGSIPFAVVNKAGTETCTLGTVGAATEVVAVSTGTLTNTFDCDTSPTAAVDIRANAVSSLTQSVLRINMWVRKTGHGLVTAQ